MSNRIYKGQSLIKEVSDYTVVDIETTGLSQYGAQAKDLSNLFLNILRITETSPISFTLSMK